MSINEKTAKRLRREAERLTQGNPARAYRVRCRDRKWGHLIGPVRLDPTCTRAVYRALKALT